MAVIHGEVFIARPPGAVFDFVADERGEPRYNPRMISSEMITDPPIRRGSRFRAMMRSPGRPTEMLVEFTAYERPTRLESVTTLPGVRIEGGLTFAPQASGTRMSWSWRILARGALRPAAPLMAAIGRRRERQIWDNLKVILECSDSASTEAQAGRLTRRSEHARDRRADDRAVGADGGVSARGRSDARHGVIGGGVASGFEPVRDAFVDNFVRRGEVGGAVCAVVAGEVVVDLWGGVRHQTTGAPWSAATMTLVHSTTKGLSATVLALLHSRGQLDYDERVAEYWPEFAQAGKDAITIRQLLAHQAGLFAFDERVDRDVVADLDRLAGVMERQRPIWPPGERQAYHAITLGFYENELVRRIDPSHRTIGRVLHEDIATPLGVGDEVYIGSPSSLPDERLAPLIPPGLWARLTKMPPRLMIDAMRPRSVLHRSLVANPGTAFYVDPQHAIVRELEVPSGGAVATARAIATVYGAFAAPGGPLGLRAQTLDLLAAPALAARRGFDDECFHGPVKFSLGFMKPGELIAFGSEAAFGAPGAGGSMGFADPTTRLGYGYVTNKMGMDLQGDARDLALRQALASVLTSLDVPDLHGRFREG